MKKRRIIKISKWVGGVLLAVLLLVVVGGFIFMRQPIFGGEASGARLLRMQQSPHYKDGIFVNMIETPTLAEGSTMLGEMSKQILKQFPRVRPLDSIPAIKTDLLHLPIDSNVIVWFGHASCFIQLHGKRMLVDPVFNNNVSPIPSSVTAFKGTDCYKVADLPAIDYVLISHDHYDHLDYKTLVELRAKTSKVICGLGVGAHLQRWGYSDEQILEKDWNEKVVVDSGFTINTKPSRHKSGRGFNQDNTLWMSYLIESPSMKIYVSGDGGYDQRFKTIGDAYGPIDLAILENGQYDSAWRYIHMLPEQTMQAAKDLRAKRVLPTHNSKFALARHPWDAPLRMLTELNRSSGILLVTPKIGEVVRLNDSTQVFEQWWTKLQ